MHIINLLDISEAFACMHGNCLRPLIVIMYSIYLIAAFTHVL